MTPRKRQVTYSQRPTHAARQAHARGEREFRTYDTSHIRRKKNKKPAGFAAVLAIVIVAVLVIGGVLLFKGCSGSADLLPDGQEVEVVIEEGSTGTAIGNKLVDAGLIAKTSDFTRRVEARDAGAKLKPGTYTFVGGTSLDDIIDKLIEGPGMTGIILTVPEGYTLKQIAERVESVTEGAITADDFAAAASDASVYAGQFPFLEGAGTNSLEGFLFPKTYSIQASDTAETLVKAMLAQYQTETASLDLSYPQAQGLSSYDVLKLASIVEKESDANHRPTVASVFYNRLANSMRLQSDATTAYEVGRNPTAADIDTHGDYNTYTNDGLPPTPICSPGIAALEAVCQPEETDYFYFYFASDDDGVMQYYFSRTYEEHQATYQ